MSQRGWGGRGLLAAVWLGSAVAGAAAPQGTAADAKKLASEKAWDDLYLKFSSGDPKALPEADRAAIAEALLKGAQALGGEDPVIALSLAERSVEFKPTVEALIAAADFNRKAKQNGQAATLLEQASKLDPANASVKVARAELALEENEPGVARDLLEKVPANVEPARVKKLKAQAQLALDSKRAEQQELERVEKEVASKQGGKGGAARPSAEQPIEVTRPGRTRPGSAGAEEPNRIDPGDRYDQGGSNLAGLREKASEHFTFAYGNNARDWGQRAEYEGRVMAALEDAYRFVSEKLGVSRRPKTEVVLYTRKEYEFHFGGSELSRAAGFFSGKIRINDAEALTDDVRAVIVHEYVHAALDDILGNKHAPQWSNEGAATWIENAWRYRNGLPNADEPWRADVMAYAKSNRLPRLDQLDVGFLGLSNPRAGYVIGGKAIELMVQKRGASGLVELFRTFSPGKFEAAYKATFPGDLAALSEEARLALSEGL